MGPNELAPPDRERLRKAKALLERPSMAARVANLFAAPFERSARLLPRPVREAIATASSAAVNRALQLSLHSLTKLPPSRKTRRWTKATTTMLGGASGFFGLPALALELPASTVLILRTIAEVAREHGEDLESAEAQLACMQVFALGGPLRSDDAAETGYYATRAAIAGAVNEAARFMSERGGLREGAPVLVRLITAIAERFGVVVSDRLLFTAIPLLGAASGAVINGLFVGHFERVARGHFAIRELERAYGSATVQAAYGAMDVAVDGGRTGRPEARS